jgi:hypothetical protein
MWICKSTVSDERKNRRNARHALPAVLLSVWGPIPGRRAPPA